MFDIFVIPYDDDDDDDDDEPITHDGNDSILLVPMHDDQKLLTLLQSLLFNIK